MSEEGHCHTVTAWQTLGCGKSDSWGFVNKKPTPGRLWVNKQIPPRHAGRPGESLLEADTPSSRGGRTRHSVWPWPVGGLKQLQFPGFAARRLHCVAAQGPGRPHMPGACASLGDCPKSPILMVRAGQGQGYCPRRQWSQLGTRHQGSSVDLPSAPCGCRCPPGDGLHQGSAN